MDCLFRCTIKFVGDAAGQQQMQVFGFWLSLHLSYWKKKSSVVGRRPWTLAPETMIFGFSNLGTRGKNLTSENDGSSNDLLNGYFEVWHCAFSKKMKGLFLVPCYISSQMLCVIWDGCCCAVDSTITGCEMDPLCPSTLFYLFTWSTFPPFVLACVCIHLLFSDFHLIPMFALYCNRFLPATLVSSSPVPRVYFTVQIKSSMKRSLDVTSYLSFYL